MTDNTPRYHYFRCPAVELTAAVVFGVVLRKPFGPAYFYFDEHKKRVFKNLGMILLSPSTGRIEAFPLEGLSELETKMLIGAAEKAFRQPPTKATGWRFNQRKAGNYWLTYISAAIKPDGNAVAKAVMSNMDNVEVQRLALKQQIVEVA
ncbi:hypothetical protein [Rhodococcus sp. KRD175]|uniref:hypothetical protein n=1 Tax=Rhodococcus sp. KRD175 TaxID=2729729 RepID=UPI0019D001B0|nr:hypothetical protein [Rhodococcus sp. KRD175]